MRKKLLAFVFAVALLVGSAVPMLGVGTAVAEHGGEEQQTRVTICHKGSPITVSVNAVDKHLDKHGDTLADSSGGCPQEVP